MSDSAIPPAGRRLTQAEQLALDLMRRHGAGVRRWPGGRSYGLDKPGKHFTARFQTRTIDSLAARGLIALDGEVYRLTRAGAAASTQELAAL
ncbi:MAG TPA: hypothetical protein PKZ99_02000 [Azospirillaceae bacterium]|nr:hypothetical protein [Azospirillaceae bacterium]